MTAEDINQFFSFLYQGTLGTIVSWFRLVAGVMTAAMVAALVIIIIKFRELLAGKARPSAPVPKVPDLAMVARPWEETQSKLASPYPSDWNIAVIKADSIVDAVLKELGLAGQTLGERLKQLDTAKLESLNDVWEAHKIRNRIAHEADHVLTHAEAERAVSLFEKTLRELQYLQ